MSDVTQILQRVEKGDGKAAEELLPLVYEELRRLAAYKMAKEPHGQTLQATALVHEAWLRIVGQEQQRWENRAKFFIAASETMRRILVERARQAKLTFEEMERGTFTISSLAQFDITFFTAILNPPQSGILTLGKVEEKPVVRDGKVIIRRMMRQGLSVDHRIIDGAVAAQFLQSLKKKLENPYSTFLLIR